MTTLAELRRYAIARSLFAPTTLARAIATLGFVQADPIRAPARAQDLILRHRVKGYRAGDLEAKYASLKIAEDYFVNYGFLPHAHQALMHPRVATRVWDRTTKKRAAEILAFVEERGTVHPRDVDAHFSHGSVKNYWGGSSSASTRLLEGMHYRGMLRVARREAGIRIYAAVPRDHQRLDLGSSLERATALMNLIVAIYAPLPFSSLRKLLVLLRSGGAPHLSDASKKALALGRETLSRAQIEGAEWVWPKRENPSRVSRANPIDDRVRFLAPFDPVVWDRTRFELFWNWTYRFEAYTPAPKRKLGYYALPMLWRDQIIGWGTFSVKAGAFESTVGYVKGFAPKDRAFASELDAEMERIRAFLGLGSF